MRSQMNPILHRSLENVCLKAIAKDPASGIRPRRRWRTI
jgi:hypothetical protein